MIVQVTHNPNALSGQEASFITMKAASARSPGDGVYISMGSDGNVDLTIANNAAVHYFAIADMTIASGAFGLYCVKGGHVLTVPSATYTAGHGLLVTTGAIVDSTAVYPAAGVAGEAKTNFGVICVGGTSVTSITVGLHGTSFTSS